jgi:hypothetical protein
MRKFLTYLAFLSIACTATTAFARGHGGGVEDDHRGFDREKFHGGVQLKQDTFFGFQTILDAGYEIQDNIDFTFYSWLWTNPNFGQIPGVGSPGGSGLWTEVGAGLNFRLFNDTLSINPQIGMLNGALLSSNVIGQDIQAGEGVVPNITINYDDEFFTAEGYFAYYMATRGDRAHDFIHNWVNAGFRPGLFNFENVPISSIGAHWEHLRLQKSRAEGGSFARHATQTIYNWVGPYIEFALPMNLALRFAGGVDLKESVAGDFYQATIKLDF